MSRRCSLAGCGAATVALVLLSLAGCGARRPAAPPPPPPPIKVTAFEIEVPKAKALPPVVGTIQSYRIKKGDTLLDVAREAGLGYREVQDANPTVDQWVPMLDTEVVGAADR